MPEPAQSDLDRIDIAVLRRERDRYREALEEIARVDRTFPMSAVLARDIARSALDQKQAESEDR